MTAAERRRLDRTAEIISGGSVQSACSELAVLRALRRVVSPPDSEPNPAQP